MIAGAMAKMVNLRATIPDDQPLPECDRALFRRRLRRVLAARPATKLPRRNRLELLPKTNMRFARSLFFLSIHLTVAGWE
jgi:hypothetical protein